MKSKRLLVVVCIAGLFLSLFFLNQQKPSAMTEVEEKIGQALGDMGDGWEMTSKTTDIPTTLKNSQGNTIIYHFLTTEYYTAPAEVSGVNLQAIQAIIDPEDAQSITHCFVNENEALLCSKAERAYLCWTLSPEYSFVIEYTPTAVAEEDIWVMAESLHLP